VCFDIVLQLCGGKVPTCRQLRVLSCFVSFRNPVGATQLASMPCTGTDLPLLLESAQEYSMAAQDTTQYLTVPDYATNANLAAQQNMRIETLTRIQRTLVTERPRTMEDCVAWAR
jgi:hypothetical protein